MTFIKRALHRTNDKGIYAYADTLNRYCQSRIRGKPTPATSLLGLSILCWLFDSREVSSRGRRAHLGASVRQNLGRKELFRRPPTP